MSKSKAWKGSDQTPAGVTEDSLCAGGEVAKQQAHTRTAHTPTQTLLFQYGNMCCQVPMILERSSVSDSEPATIRIGHDQRPAYGGVIGRVAHSLCAVLQLPLNTQEPAWQVACADPVPNQQLPVQVVPFCVSNSRGHWSQVVVTGSRLLEHAAGRQAGRQASHACYICTK